MSKVLVVVDMQKDFIDGALGTKEAVALVPKVVDKIMNYDGLIYTTQDTHHDDYLDTLEGRKLPVKHCIEGTEGWKIKVEVLLAMLQRDDGHSQGNVRKSTFGSFELVDRIADHMPEVEEIELCGLCTDICVISNALILRSAFPDTRIVVDGNLTEGVTPESKSHALETMKMCQIDVI